MKLLTLTATALLGLATALTAQTAGTASTPAATSQPAPTSTGKAAKATKAPLQQAPGGGPDQVWVNTNSSVYHCPGDRYYGKTAHGRYMTEAAAKSAGGKGVGGKTCFAGK